MPLGLGPLELGIILVIVLVFVGPKKLPGLGKSLGSGMREFKEEIQGGDKGKHKDTPEVEAPAPLPVTDPLRKPDATAPAAEPAEPVQPPKAD